MGSRLRIANNKVNCPLSKAKEDVKKCLSCEEAFGVDEKTVLCDKGNEGWAHSN